MLVEVGQMGVKTKRIEIPFVILINPQTQIWGQFDPGALCLFVTFRNTKPHNLCFREKANGAWGQIDPRFWLV